MHFDEAQYWSWSKNLDWGYFSKPPLIAWLIFISSKICGNEEHCIRALSPIFHLFSSLLIAMTIFQINKDLKSSFYGSILYLLMPGVAYSSFFMTTDVPLLFFSSLITFCLTYLYKVKKSKFIWILLGVAFGMGMLSKYAILYYIFSLIIATALINKIRLSLFRRELIYVIIISITIFLPNLIWNFEHGLVTFNHTFDNANLNNLRIDLLGPPSFLLSQFILFGPIPFFLALLIFIKKDKRGQLNSLFVILFFFPIFMMFLLGFFSRVNANWAVVGFAPGVVLLVSYYYKNKSNFIWSSVFLTQIIIATLINYFVIFSDSNNFDPFAKYRNINEFGEKIGMIVSTYDNVGFMSDDREDYAYMLYYMEPKPVRMAKWNGNIKIDDHFDLTTDTDDLAGLDVILLTRTEPTQSMLVRCKKHSKISEIIVGLGRNKERRYNLYLLEDWILASKAGPDARR